MVNKSFVIPMCIYEKHKKEFNELKNKIDARKTTAKNMSYIRLHIVL